MADLRTGLRGTVWLIYAVFVFEILFMISPAALYFYSVYSPVLTSLDRSPKTAWLTQFFLPHISVTANPVLNMLPELGWMLLLSGTLLFLLSVVPLYWAKLRRRGAVTSGVYRFIRHPQYVGLAVMGLGTLLIWPRILVLVSFITMLFLYGLLAGWEEEQCLARYGESYRAYQAKTGMFLPRTLSPGLPRLLPVSGFGRALTGLALFVAVMGLSLAAAFGLREYSLSQIVAIYREDEAVISPARLTDAELDGYRTAVGDNTVRAALAAAKPGQRLVYVVPRDWYLPDLPIEAAPPPGGFSHGSAVFDRSHYKVLFARARSHKATATGRDILTTAYGLDPIVVARVDIAAHKVTAVQNPPAHVYWGDIPTPTF
ncbi:MAG TPA: isoprenylcysteine carboxylmethyltransferase family protein [Hyphomicrobiaceae bacterium]|nr:isoprenylcysteine carboxylmethyltransferase family protein [Hyphomicrobiaceae bacterium]